jgi:excisionase family DNA binding protein
MKVFVVHDNQVKEFVSTDNFIKEKFALELFKDELNLEPETLQKSLEKQSQLITISQLTKLFSTSRPTIYAWIDKKLLNPIKIGGRVYFNKQDIEKLLEASKSHKH